MPQSENNLPFARRSSLSLLIYSSAPALIFAYQFPRKKEKTEKFEVERSRGAVKNAWFFRLPSNSLLSLLLLKVIVMA